MHRSRLLALAACTLAAFACLPADAQAANTITLTADIVKAPGSATPTLTWSTAPVATGCTASGAWSGAKAASGSEKQPAITASKTYTLTCTFPGETFAVFTWAAPTQNTDGSALTDLAGFRIYEFASATATTALSTPVSINSPGITVFQLDTLGVGTHWWDMTAFNTAGVESDHSARTSKTISSAPSGTQSLGITVDPKPRGVSGLSVR